MVFDILFVIFIGLGFYQGFKNGVIYSIFSLLGWFLGIIAALKFSYLLINFLHGFAQLSPKVLAIISDSWKSMTVADNIPISRRQTIDLIEIP